MPFSWESRTCSVSVSSPLVYFAGRSPARAAPAGRGAPGAVWRPPAGPAAGSAAAEPRARAGGAPRLLPHPHEHAAADVKNEAKG